MELQQLRRRRRVRRIGVAVLSASVVILAAIWLNHSKPTSDEACQDWQANYAFAVAHDTGGGIGVNQMLALRPADCSIPLVPHPSQ